MQYFSISELTHSNTAARLGIHNDPPASVRSNLEALINNILDPLRALNGGPIAINSGYRCPELNRAVGGSSRSQHMQGKAADIRNIPTSKLPNNTNRRLFDLIANSSLPFDQLIDEYNYKWVHVSFDPDRATQRRQILHLSK